MTMRSAMKRYVAATLSWVLLLVMASTAVHAREAAPAYDPQGYVSDHAGVI